MANAAIDLAEKLPSFSEHWSPKVVARPNDYEIKVVKGKGEFVWHTHDDADELFLVIDGELTIQLRDGDVTLRPGQIFVVPRGIEQRGEHRQRWWHSHRCVRRLTGIARSVSIELAIHDWDTRRSSCGSGVSLALPVVGLTAAARWWKGD